MNSFPSFSGKQSAIYNFSMCQNSEHENSELEGSLDGYLDAQINSFFKKNVLFILERESCGEAEGQRV